MSDEFTWDDTGLKADWNGTIKSGVFRQQERGTWALELVSTADDGEEVKHRPYGTGGVDKGWTSHDGGETIVGATAEQQYHSRSGIARFYDSLIEAGAGDELRRRSKELYNRRGPYHADLLVGMRFHWDVVKETVNRPKDPTAKEWESVEVDTMKPLKYLEVQPELQASQARHPSSSTENGEISPEDLIALKLLAVESDGWTKFADAVMSSTGANGEPYTRNPYIRRNLSKASWWESLRG